MVGKKLIGRRFYLHVAYLWAVETGMHVGVELELLSLCVRVSFAGVKKV
jgi:hypothetical protein